jgi:hypothetical protein
MKGQLPLQCSQSSIWVKVSCKAVIHHRNSCLSNTDPVAIILQNMYSMRPKVLLIGWTAISILLQRYGNALLSLYNFQTNLFHQGRPRLKKAIADAYTPFFNRTLNPDNEVTITTGANEGK